MYRETPSNYETLPQVRLAAGPGIDAVSHERLRANRWSGRWVLDLVAIDPWRVGSGTQVVIARPDASGRRREDLAEDLMLWRHQDPVLPGSSLKGAVRTLVEALTGGDEPSPRPSEVQTVASALFGMASPRESFRGRVGFDDALPVAGQPLKVDLMDLPAPYEPRAHLNTGPRVYGPAASRPGEVPMLVIRPGSRLRTQMSFLNLSEDELGLLAWAMGLDGSFCPRLGGGKFAGLGRTRFELVSADLKRGGARRGPPVEGAELASALRRWLDAAPLSPDQEKVVRLFRRQMGAP